MMVSVILVRHAANTASPTLIREAVNLSCCTVQDDDVLLLTLALLSGILQA